MKKDNKTKNQFLLAVQKLKNKKEINEFFNSLLTLSEIDMLSKRFSVAKMVLEKSTYYQIKNKLKVTNSKVSSVKNHLKVVGNKGLLKIIQRMNKKK